MNELDWCRLHELSRAQLERLLKMAGIDLGPEETLFGLRDELSMALVDGRVSWGAVDEMEREAP